MRSFPSCLLALALLTSCFCGEPQDTALVDEQGFRQMADELNCAGSIASKNGMTMRAAYKNAAAQLGDEAMHDHAFVADFVRQLCADEIHYDYASEAFVTGPAPEKTPTPDPPTPSQEPVPADDPSAPTPELIPPEGVTPSETSEPPTQSVPTGNGPSSPFVFPMDPADGLGDFHGSAFSVENSQVPLAFFLKERDRFCADILEILTGSQSIVYERYDVFKNRYVFKTTTAMSQGELFHAVTKLTPTTPEAQVAPGSIFKVAAQDLPWVPRLVTRKIDYENLEGETKQLPVTIDLGQFANGLPEPTYVSPTYCGVGDYRTSADLRTMIDTRPLVQNVAREIVVPYRSDEDRIDALKVAVGRIPYMQEATGHGMKSPAMTLLCNEKDCKGATILLMSLLRASGYLAGFVNLDSTIHVGTGHVAATVPDSVYPAGSGLVIDGTTWWFADAAGVQENYWIERERTIAKIKQTATARNMVVTYTPPMPDRIRDGEEWYKDKQLIPTQLYPPEGEPVTYKDYCEIPN